MRNLIRQSLHVSAVSATIFAVSSVAAHAQSLYWDFGTSASPTALPTTNSAANLSVTEGVSVFNSFGNPAELTTTSVSSGYAGVSGGVNAGIDSKPNTSDLSLHTDTSSYFEFTITPTAGYEVQLNGISFGERSTATGPQAFSIMTGDLSSTLATGSFINNSTWAFFNPTVTAYTTAVSAPLTVRLYGYAGTGNANSGTVNWRIDDLTVSASAIQVGGAAASPEPGSIALLGAGLLPIGAVIRRRMSRRG